MCNFCLFSGNSESSVVSGTLSQFDQLFWFHQGVAIVVEFNWSECVLRVVFLLSQPLFRVRYSWVSNPRWHWETAGQGLSSFTRRQGKRVQKGQHRLIVRGSNWAWGRWAGTG